MKTDFFLNLNQT